MPSIKLISILFRRWFSSQGFHEGEEIDADLDETDLPEISYFNKVHISPLFFYKDAVEGFSKHVAKIQMLCLYHPPGLSPTYKEN